ncbi:MAG: transcriptional regulator, MarR family [Solirubrobacterales bacterium]|jgi:DNA-binding MarR family transcriptional regulator|nr:transcriptional regulator, MarR family [Solirubrobacterales bacterium]
MVLLTRLAKQVYRRTNEEQLGMQLRHLVALTFLRDHEACPQQELGDAFCMDANNVVLLLNELEDLGYATRQRDPLDRRRHVVQLTAAGRSALEVAERAQETVEDDVLRALDEEDRKILWELLTRALRGVEPADGPPVVVGAATGLA